MTMLHFKRNYMPRKSERVNKTLPQYATEVGNVETAGKATTLDQAFLRGVDSVDDDTDPLASTDQVDSSDNEIAHESRFFGAGMLSLIGRRSHDVQEFLSRLRAQEMSQAYEQGKTSDFELHKLQAATTATIGSATFGPCMTYKQAVERIQEQQMFQVKTVATSEASLSSRKAQGGTDKENDRQVDKYPTKTQWRRAGNPQSQPLSYTKRQAQNSWMRSDVDKQLQSLQSMLSVDTLTPGPFSSQGSVAPTEPESPMSCDGSSVFC